MFGVCQHKWNTIVDELIPSQVERLCKVAARLNRLSTVWPDMYKSTKIIILECTKCGKLNKTIEKV